MKDDTYKYIVHSLDNSTDLVTLPRKFVQDCKMKTEGFERLFFDLATENNHPTAYRKAEDLHVKLFGVQRFSSYESFKVRLTQRYGPHSKSVFDK